MPGEITEIQAPDRRSRGGHKAHVCAKAARQFLTYLYNTGPTQRALAARPKRRRRRRTCREITAQNRSERTQKSAQTEGRNC